MAFTRVLGPGIHTQANIDSHNINSTGIITATRFDGPFVNLNVTGVTTFTDATFTGNVSIGGTLTYEDVSNVDSVGIITALGFKTRGTSSDAGATNGFTAGRINIYDNNSHNIFRIGSHPSYAPTVFSTSNITFSTNGFYVRNTAATRDYIGINNSTGILQLGFGAASGHGYKLETSAKGIKVGTGVTIETNGQATYTGIITATAFQLADGSAIGAGAGGTWSSYTAGIATTKSVGINTSSLDDNDLVGVGNSFQGLYISNGMMITDNSLNGNHYIGTAFNGLMAGPVNIEGTLTIDGNYVVV